MKTSLRLFAGAVALLTVSLTMTACDTSPYAASVDGHVIKQLTLNDELAQWTVNKAFVKEENGSASSAITGAGGVGSYTSSFTADILDQLITDSVLRAHLASTSSQPSAAMVAAARGYYDTTGTASDWYGFPPQLRDFLAQSLADEAAFVTLSPANASTLAQGYAQVQADMFLQICVRQATAATAAQAATLQTDGVPADAAVVCYDQSTLEGQPQNYRTAVLALVSGGSTKPISTSYGYQVATLVSRQTVPFDSDTQKVLTFVLDRNNSVGIPALASVVEKASVKVNPAYGTWSSTNGSITPPATKG